VVVAQAVVVPAAEAKGHTARSRFPPTLLKAEPWWRWVVPARHAPAASRKFKRIVDARCKRAFSIASV
jgi:hypothetical protein